MSENENIEQVVEEISKNTPVINKDQDNSPASDTNEKPNIIL